MEIIIMLVQSGIALLGKLSTFQNVLSKKKVQKKNKKKLKKKEFKNACGNHEIYEIRRYKRTYSIKGQIPSAFVHQLSLLRTLSDQDQKCTSRRYWQVEVRYLCRLSTGKGQNGNSYIKTTCITIKNNSCPFLYSLSNPCLPSDLTGYIKLDRGV